MKLILLTIALSLAPLPAQTLQLDNTANSGLDDAQYGADFVAGDTFSLQIESAAASSAVTLLETQNGVSTTGGVPWLAGYTDASGNFTLTGTESADYIADYTQQWFVNGNQVGSELVFEVIPRPTSLSVASVTLPAWRNQCTAVNYFWGVFVDITYDILGTPGDTNIATSILMTPTEEGTFYDNGNVPAGNYANNVGAPGTQYSDSATYAANDGTFHDVPVGTCYNGGFSGGGATQTLFIDIGNNTYEVRGLTRFVTSSSSNGHGSITNDLDVTATR